MIQSFFEEYLGDGVYVKLDSQGDVVLTKGSHLNNRATNIIVLDNSVFEELKRWIAAREQK